MLRRYSNWMKRFSTSSPISADFSLMLAAQLVEEHFLHLFDGQGGKRGGGPQRIVEEALLHLRQEGRHARLRDFPRKLRKRSKISSNSSSPVAMTRSFRWGSEMISSRRA